MPSLGKELGLSTGTVGALSELRVAIDLMKRGFHVFRALSPACPADLVIYSNGAAPQTVQVRTGYGRSTGDGAVRIYASREGTHDIMALALTDRIVYEPEPLLSR